MYTPTYIIYTDLIYTLVFKKQKQKILIVQNVEEKYIIHSFLSIWTNIQIFKLFVKFVLLVKCKKLKSQENKLFWNGNDQVDPFNEKKVCCKESIDMKWPIWRWFVYGQTKNIVWPYKSCLCQTAHFVWKENWRTNFFIPCGFHQVIYRIIWCFERSFLETPLQQTLRA